MRLFVIAAIVSLCFAHGFAAPAEVKEEKKVEEKVEEKKTEEKVETKSEDKLEKREGKSIKQSNVYLGSSEHKNAHAPSYAPDLYQPAYGALTSDPLETAIGYVYYYLPTAENYLPKYETMKKFSPIVKRAMPIMKRMYSEASERVSGWSTSLVAAFAGLATSAGVMAAALSGRRKRDLTNEIEDSPVDNEIAPLFVEQESMMKIAREVDKLLMSYINIFAEPGCMEKLFCEGGDLTVRLGGTVVRPVLKLVEPLLPESLKSYTDAFKQGYRDRSACSRSSCTYSFF